MGVSVLSIDGIIFSLQQNGGISVYFQELFKRMLVADVGAELLLFDELAVARTGVGSESIQLCHSRFLERYRECLIPANTELFHSSYYRLPQSKKIPAVTTVHDFTYERFKSGPKRWIHSTQKMKAIREARAVICVSDNTRNDLLEFIPDVDKGKVRVIHNGVGKSFFPIEIEIGSSSKRPYVIYVGSRVWYKNFSSAVNALSSLSDVELVCVGGGAFTESERRILERLLPGRYRHEGLVNDERLNYLYNNATCLLYPSSYEGFGIPVLEAMRAGCPVVALKLSSIPEVAGDAAILLESAEPDLLVKAIEQMTDNDFRKEIRQKGFLQSCSFSWDQTFNQTIKVYEEVLGQTLPCKVAQENVF